MNMSKEEKESFCAGLLLGFLAACLCAITTAVVFTTPNSVWKGDAVKHNAAQWIANKNGAPEFKWNDEIIKARVEAQQ